MIGEWVLAGNRHIPKDLNSTAHRYDVGEKEGGVSKLIKLGVDTTSIPLEWLSKYCEQDVRITVGVFLKQRQLLSNRQQLHLQYARCLLTPVLADIETNGVSLDKKEVYDEYERVRNEYESCQRSLQLLYKTMGGDEAGINWRSRKQVAEFIYGTLGFAELSGRDGQPSKTDGGARRTDSAAIGNLKPFTKAQKDFIKLFKISTLLSAKLTKTLQFFKVVCDEHDGTFYGIFNQGIAATHRLTSNGRKIAREDGEDIGSQLQNMPREYKRLIKAKKDDNSIIEIDGSGLEFRVAADLGHDEVAYREIVDGADIHAITAKALTDAGEPTDRQNAKSRTFRPLYGGSSGTPAEQAYCKFFRNKYKGIFKTQTEWTYTVLTNKELRTAYGMIFYWPDTTVSKSGFITNTTSIFNYPVQGLATAEIIPAALVHVWHKTKHLDVRIILTIHDSVVMEVGQSVNREELYKILYDCFTVDVYKFMKACYNYSIWCPLGAEIKEGKRWGEGDGLKKTIFPEI